MTNYLILKQSHGDPELWTVIDTQEATSTEIAVRKQIAVLQERDGQHVDGTYVAVADSGWRPYTIGMVNQPRLLVTATK